MATSSTTNTSAAQKPIDRLADTAHGAIDRASEMAGRLGGKTDELWGMKDEYVESARDYVKQNPLMALGLALAAGYLFGKISSWRWAATAAVFPPVGVRPPRQPGLGELAGRLVSDTRQLVSDFAQLAVLDARRAGVRLAMLLSAGLLIAILVITAWMGFVAAGIVWMFDQGVSWPLAIAVAAVINLVAAA